MTADLIEPANRLAIKMTTRSIEKASIKTYQHVGALGWPENRAGRDTCTNLMSVLTSCLLTEWIVKRAHVQTKPIR
jgi:hypothetical protein